ncbi:UPF0164 family protein [bacterium]|nr:UPF0164 family protein [bacterium]
MLIESEMYRISIIIIVITTLLTLSMNSIASITGATATTGIGGRAAVFDEAFVAIANDASAIYWNPAGLVSLRNRYNSTLSRNSIFSGLFGLMGIRREFIGLAYSEQRFGVGMSLDLLGTNRVIEADDYGKISPDKGSYSESRVSFSLSGGSPHIASIGLTGNYFRIGSATSSNCASVDIGILSKPFVLFRRSQSETQLHLRLGTTLRNLYHSLDISPQYSLAGASQLRSRWGVLRRFGESSLTFALAYTNSIAPNRTPKFALGIEFGPDISNLSMVNHVKLYYGVGYYPSVTDSLNWKTGIRIGVGDWQFDPIGDITFWFSYAREQARFLGGSDRATIDLGFNTKLIQDVTIGKIEDGGIIKRTDFKYETTDKIAIVIYLLNDISLAELQSLANLQRFGIKVVLTDPTSTKIEEIGYDKMDSTDGYAPRYTFQPVRDWLRKFGFIQSGEYTVEIFVNDKVSWKKTFQLRYDLDVQRIVENARQLFDVGDLKSAEDELLKAVQNDPSYPDTYYIAGLVSELSDDFLGAQRCYIEAQKLNPDKIIDFQYLQPLIEQQESQNRPGIQLYERLKQASVRPVENNNLDQK